MARGSSGRSRNADHALGNAKVPIALGKNLGDPGVEEEKDEGIPRGVSNYLSKVIVVTVA